MLDRRVSIAPMMDCTDRYYRYLMRFITRHAVLYSEMLTPGAVIHGDRNKLLGFDEIEHPIACQLGGSDVSQLQQAATIVEDAGYDEINLNVGCPSDRVQAGCFGAYLMKFPDKVAACVAAMQKVVSIPVTVKCRIGVDECDRYEDLCRFMSCIADVGCQHVSVHARKAWLQGLSPRDNRTIPPLKYPVVYQVKQDFPQCEVAINGGIQTIAQMHEHLQHVDGVMIGRAAYANPYMMASVDQEFYGDDRAVMSRHDILREYMPYVIEHVRQGAPLRMFAKHLMGLFLGEMGAKAWRRSLAKSGCLRQSSLDDFIRVCEDVLSGNALC